MQYETIILELMSRIKVLEDEVARIKEALSAPEAAADIGDNAEPDADPSPASAPRGAGTYTKMTDPMMEICYVYGKRAYRSPDANVGEYADAAAAEVHMNRNTAFMYIHGVKNLLAGKVFKRAISARALRKYFSAIYDDFGAAGLANALQATRANIEYREQCGLPSESILALCEEFQQKL